MTELLNQQGSMNDEKLVVLILNDQLFREVMQYERMTRGVHFNPNKIRSNPLTYMIEKPYKLRYHYSEAL